MSIKERWIEMVLELQDVICAAIEQSDGSGKFLEDVWERDGGGGGRTRVLTDGSVFEKGGVNTSVVYGKVSDKMRQELSIDGDRWFACGLSLVIHPQNPFVPTVHCNYRMFELYNKNDEVTDRWFGGGTDLTPYYLFEQDARHFHQTYKDVCDSSDETFYPQFKKDCDNYFVNEHRNRERRGIGGIFYDHQKPNGAKDSQFWLNFSKSCGYALINAYIPIVEKRKNIPWSEPNKKWQEIRRGRYVEFNLLHDRGTIFGLKTNGRTESILMSLPTTVRFEYNYQPATGSDEELLLRVCLQPKEWI
jgi:coproporphyrinogen III oxidase